MLDDCNASITPEEIKRWLLKEIENIGFSQNMFLIRLLLQRIPCTENIFTERHCEKIKNMVFLWQWIMSINKAEICLLLAERSFPLSGKLRTSLDVAIRQLMPSYLAADDIFNALEIYNAEVTADEIAKRFRICRNFHKYSCVFLEREHMGERVWGWYKVPKIVAFPCSDTGDIVGKNLRIESLDGLGVQRMMPLSSLVKHMTFFLSSGSIFSFVNDYKQHGKINFDIQKWASLLRHESLNSIPAEQAIKIIQLTLVAIDEGKTITWNRPGQRQALFTEPPIPHDTTPSEESPKETQRETEPRNHVFLDRMDPKTNYTSYLSISKLGSVQSDFLCFINEISANRSIMKTDAARFYLENRLSSLSREKDRLQPILFRTISIGRTVDLGCAVTLQFENGFLKTFFILGEGDPKHFIFDWGNAESNCKHISYKTRIAQTLRWKGIDDRVSIPGDGTAIITAIKPLPPELIRELDCE